MDSVATEDRPQADDRFDTARITPAVDALAEKHAGREDVFRQALAQLLKAAMIAARAEFDRELSVVRAFSRLIRNLAVGELIVAGDLGVARRAAEPQASVLVVAAR